MAARGTHDVPRPGQTRHIGGSSRALRQGGLASPPRSRRLQPTRRLPSTASLPTIPGAKRIGAACRWKDRARLVWHTAIRFAATRHPALWLECGETSRVVHERISRRLPPKAPLQGRAQRTSARDIIRKAVRCAPGIGTGKGAARSAERRGRAPTAARSAGAHAEYPHSPRQCPAGAFAIVREYQNSALVPKSRQGTQVTLVVETRSNRIATG